MIGEVDAATADVVTADVAIVGGEIHGCWTDAETHGSAAWDAQWFAPAVECGQELVSGGDESCAVDVVVAAAAAVGELAVLPAVVGGAAAVAVPVAAVVLVVEVVVAADAAAVVVVAAAAVVVVGSEDMEEGHALGPQNQVMCTLDHPPRYLQYPKQLKVVVTINVLQ